jgi:hypothetical protein
VKLNINRVVGKVIYLLAAKYKILYKIGILNKLIELRSAIRFINSLKKYSILSSRLLNILIMLIRPYISSISSIKLIDFTCIMSIK